MAEIKIVAGVNFSQCSTNALNFALSLYQNHIIHLYLISVIPPVIEHKSSYDEDFASVYTHNSQLINSLKNSIISNNKNSSISVSTEIITGYPEEVMTLRSREIKPFLVVIGSSLKPNTLAELLGSLTSDIIKKSSAPILTVPTDTNYPTKALSNVLLITDFRSKSDTLIDHIKPISITDNLTIHCVHFCSNKPDKFDNERLITWKKQLSLAYPQINLICSTLVGKNIQAEIQKYLSKNSIEMIAISRKKHHAISRFFHPDITKKLLFNTKLPVLVFNT